MFPAITQTAIGKQTSMQVFGDDYNTRDGSCIRDYVHVCDIANAHSLALQYLIQKSNSHNLQVFNLGTGKGVSVFEAIKAFETVSGIKLNYTLGKRRSGDVVAIYANNNLAKEKLGWQPQFNLEAMMQTAWAWELSLKNEAQIIFL